MCVGQCCIDLSPEWGDFNMNSRFGLELDTGIYPVEPVSQLHCGFKKKKFAVVNSLIVT